MNGIIVYEGDKLFGEHHARAEAVEQHKGETGHRLLDFYWETRCLDCGWEVTLSIVRGNPFNPYSAPAVQRVTVWPPKVEPFGPVQDGGRDDTESN